MERKMLVRGAGWVLVIRDNASESERNAYGHAPDSRAVAALVGPRINQEVCEVLYVLHLNGQHRVIGMTEVARGGLHGISSISARDIFRAACAQGASAIICVHNHPSGDPTPSQEDIAFTVNIKEAGEVLGIPVLDHVVVSTTGYRSLLDMGLMS